MPLFADFAFALAAAAAASNAVPQHRETAKSKSGHAKTVVVTKAAKPNHRETCQRVYRNYDARTDTYTDARGKRQRCTR